MRRSYRWPILVVLCLALALAGCGKAPPTAMPDGAAAATPAALAPPSAALPTATAGESSVSLPPVTDGIAATINSTVVPTESKQTWVTDLAFADDRHGWMVVNEANSAPTLYATTDGGQTWDAQPNSQGITNVEAVSAAQIWSVRDSKLIYSTDGGKRWQDLQSDTLPDRVSQIDFSDESHGWATGVRTDAGQLLYRTADSGQRWEQITTRDPCRERQGSGGYSFVSPLVGWELCSFWAAGGSTPRALYKTEDGAQTWTLLTETTREHVSEHGLDMASGSYGISFINERDGWFSGQYATIKTSDGGLTWWPTALEAASPGAGHRWVRFVTSRNGYAYIYGSYSTLLKTTDGGEHWTPIYHSAVWPSGIIRFTGANTGVAAGTPLDLGAVLRTSDGGESWRVVGRIGEPTTKIVQYSFADADTGWAYSYDGGLQRQPATCGLHRTTDGGTTWRQLPMPGSDLACGEQGVSIDFIDRQTGFLAQTGAGGSRLIITHDGGESFQSVAQFPFALQQLDFIDATTGWAISGETGAAGAVVATGDGGQTWRTLPRIYRLPSASPASPGAQRGVPISPVYGVSAPSLFPGDMAWLFVSILDPMQGVKSLILRTDDGGANWTRYQLAGKHFGVPQFVDPDHGWLITTGALYRTTDGGRTWVQLRA